MKSDDWQTKLWDNKSFDQNTPYSLKKILENLDKVSDLDHFNPYYLLSPIYDFTKVFYKISSALGMGFNDITKKVEIMRHNFMFFYPMTDNIQDLILDEIKQGIYILDGKNNYEKGHSSGKYKDYVSGTRTFLRLLWFMEFLIKIARYTVAHDEMSLKEILKTAYNEVLAPRHRQVVIAAVNVALTFAGASKEDAVKDMFEVPQFDAAAKEKITMVADKLEKIWKAGHDFYIKNGLKYEG